MLQSVVDEKLELVHRLHAEQSEISSTYKVYIYVYMHTYTHKYMCSSTYKVYICVRMYIHKYMCPTEPSEISVTHKVCMRTSFFPPNWRALEISNLTLLEFVQGVHAGDGAVQENPR